MVEPAWVLDAVVHAFHERLLAEHGGRAGLRDTTMLESALARPKNLRLYATPTMCELAAAYAFGLVKNHPFIDGNKRIGFACAVVFLELNGRSFHSTEADAVLRTLALAAGEMSELEYACWLEPHSHPHP